MTEEPPEEPAEQAAGGPTAEPSEGAPLWEPSADRIADAEVTRFRTWLAEHRGVELADFERLLEWSLADVEAYWSAVWEYFGLPDRAPGPLLADPAMPGTVWCPGTTLNFAEYALRHTGDGTAVLFRNERGAQSSLTRDQLRRRVAEVAAGLRKLGVGSGDRVVGFLPNIPETLVAFYACASIGAVWSCCSPDFGVPSVVERFRQIEPKVLIAVDGYTYHGRAFDRTDVVAHLREALPSLHRTVIVPYLDSTRPHEPGTEPHQPGTEPHQPGPMPPPPVITWTDLGRPGAPLEFTPVGFGHPLWVLYSSGTTGPPKAIVHGHGGALLGGVAALGLCYDVRPTDRYFWFSSTGWAVWNLLGPATMRGATVVLYDGSPLHPTDDALWRMAAELGVTWFGAGAPLMLEYRRRGLRPGDDHDLGALRTVATTGAPMPAEGARWIYDAVGPDLWCVSVSGGTDTLVPLVAGAPVLPVRGGEIQSRCLGTDVQAFSDAGERLDGEVGELVVTQPLPSFPVCLWGDDDGSRLRETYFDLFPGVWRHGDWIRFTDRGSAVILGRSDATIKRMGVRIGSAEIYAVVDEHPAVADSLAIDVGRPGEDGQMVLFVQLRPERHLTAELERELRDTVRTRLSPRHVPDVVRAVRDIPRTLNGKKMEVPVKRILLGQPVERAVKLGSVANPRALDEFAAMTLPLR